MGILSSTFIHVCRCLKTYVCTYYVWIDYRIKLHLFICITVLKSVFASFALLPSYLNHEHPCKAGTSLSVPNHQGRKCYELTHIHRVRKRRGGLVQTIYLSLHQIHIISITSVGFFCILHYLTRGPHASLAFRCGRKDTKLLQPC